MQWWKWKVDELGDLRLKGSHNALFSHFTFLPLPLPTFPTQFPAGKSPSSITSLSSISAILIWVMSKCSYCDYKISSFNRPLFHFGRRYSRSHSLFCMHAPFCFLFSVSYICFVMYLIGFWKYGFQLGLGLPSLRYLELLWWEFWCFSISFFVLNAWVDSKLVLAKGNTASDISSWMVEIIVRVLNIHLFENLINSWMCIAFVKLVIEICDARTNLTWEMHIRESKCNFHHWIASSTSWSLFGIFFIDTCKRKKWNKIFHKPTS